VFGAWFWILSIAFSSSNPDYVFNTREALSFVHIVYIFTMNFNMIGLAIGIYSNLSPYLPETVVAICFTFIVYLMGFVGKDVDCMVSICCTNLSSRGI